MPSRFNLATGGINDAGSSRLHDVADLEMRFAHATQDRQSFAQIPLRHAPESCQCPG